MLKRKNFVIMLIFSFSLLFLGDGRTVLAKTSVDVTNRFETGIVDIGIKVYQEVNGKEEIWEDKSAVMPGDRVSKIPRIYNYGTDCYVRVKITFREAGEINESHLLGMSDQWIKADDGYYYYTEILKNGEETDVFLGLQIPEELSEEMAERSFYIDIEPDAIQSKNFTPDFDAAAPWGSIEILKCEKEGQYDVDTFKKADQQSFTIEYQGDTGKLVKNKDDFFKNFPYLMPGDKYSDFVEVVNDDKNEDLRIYFRSEAYDDSELLEKIMLRIATDINGKKQTVYYGDLKAAKLSTDDFLGVIPRASKGIFYFEIEVPEELDNKYTILDSYVKWIFSTKPIRANSDGTINNPDTGKPVQTGDGVNVWLYMSVMVSAGGMALFVWREKNFRKERRK